MKKFLLLSLVSVMVFNLSVPGASAFFNLVDEQPLLSSQQTESEIAQLTKYPTWLRPSLEKAGWIKKGQVIDAKTATAIEVRLCREFLGGSDAECRNPQGSASIFIISALAQYTSLDRTTAPDSLLTSAAIKKTVADRITQILSKKQSSCSYSLVASLMGMCMALEAGANGFPGVTKTVATKHVRNAEVRYQELLKAIEKLDKEKLAAYKKELTTSGLEGDLKLAQTAFTKKRYAEAYTAGLTFGWAMESVTIQLQRYLDKRSPVTAAMVAERKKLYDRELSTLQQRHPLRGGDDAYLLRYGVYARNLRNVQESMNSSSFALLRTDEQMGMYDIALDIISLIDLGAKAKI